MLELIFLGHTNVQVLIVERNQKLQLEADEALVLKMFANKLPTLFLKVGVRRHSGKDGHFYLGFLVTKDY
eukprot:8450800-Ditylum_brightwellii.AAC.1